MEVLCEQRISLGQETNTRTPLISVLAPVAASHDHLEENTREGGFLNFGSLNDLLGYLARQGYVAEKAVDLVHAEDALSVMDMIQHHLDEEGSHDNLYLRKSCIRCLLHLNKRHGTLPTSIHLSQVTKDGHHPVSGGGFADIYKGRLGDTQQTVCLKVLRVYTATYDEKRLLKQLSNEVLIWRQLKHPNILQFLGITKELFKPSYCIVSPWMKNGNIISYSRAHVTTLNAKIKMMYEISEGIRYLHEHQPPIVHSDIKGLNILVSDEGTCHLADFGLATIENDSPESQVHLSTSQAVVRGSVPWLAPELMNPDHIGVPCRTTRDIYALGCTIFELLTGNAPFSEKKMDFQIIMEVLNGSRPVRPDGCPDLLWSVVESCWKEDFEMRPSAAKVVRQLAEMSGEAVRSYEDALPSPRKEGASERVWENGLLLSPPSSPTVQRGRYDLAQHSSGGDSFEMEMEREREREYRIRVVDPSPHLQHPDSSLPNHVRPSTPSGFNRASLERPCPTSEYEASTSASRRRQASSPTDYGFRSPRPSSPMLNLPRGSTSALEDEAEEVQHQMAGQEVIDYKSGEDLKKPGDYIERMSPPHEYLKRKFASGRNSPADEAQDRSTKRVRHVYWDESVDVLDFPLDGFASDDSDDVEWDCLLEADDPAVGSGSMDYTDAPQVSMDISPDRLGVQQKPESPPRRLSMPDSDTDEGFPRPLEINAPEGDGGSGPSNVQSGVVPATVVDTHIATWDTLSISKPRGINDNISPALATSGVSIGTGHHHRRASSGTRSERGESEGHEAVDPGSIATPSIFRVSPYTERSRSPRRPYIHGSGRDISPMTAAPSSNRFPPDVLRLPSMQDLQFDYTPRRQDHSPRSAFTVTSGRTARASHNRRKQEAAFQCPVPGCGSAFTRSFNLKGHMRSHDEGPKLFICHWPGCGKGFAGRDDCERHERLHASYRPFICEGCQKSFARMDALDRHLRSEGGAECRRALLVSSTRGVSEGYEVEVQSFRDSPYLSLNNVRFDEEPGPSGSEQRDNQKTKIACARCRKLKVRCEVDTGPCKRCLNGGHRCVIPERVTHRPSPLHDGRFKEELDPGRSEHRAKPACARCKMLKMRCEFKVDTGPCERCLYGGHECVTPGRKKRGSARKYAHKEHEIIEEEAEDHSSEDGYEFVFGDFEGEEVQTDIKRRISSRRRRSFYSSSDSADTELAALPTEAAPFGLLAKLGMTSGRGTNVEVGDLLGTPQVTGDEDVGVANANFFSEPWDYESLREAWNRFRARVGLR